MSDQQGDANACAPYGGFAKYENYGWKVPLAGCRQWCPQCVQYCYIHQILCRNGQMVNIYSQLTPYRSDAEQSAELSQIQAQERHDTAQFAASPAWENLSPIPQFLILGLSIALTAVAWRGLADVDWHMALLSLFNPYLAVSLLFFNTTAKGSSGFAYWLDTTLFFHSWLFLLALIGVIAAGAVPFVKGWDYYFVKHPAEPIVNEALSSGTAIDNHALASALTTSAEEINNPLPAWHYEHQAEKARKLKEKLDRDTELARAAIVRERARAALEDEQQASAADARERVWRGGTMK
jgi:hypothetical protein